MGAWGTGPFDNDDALDFVGDLVERSPAEARAALEATLRAVADAGSYLEVIEANEAVAAAAMVAGLVEGALPEDDPAVERWAAGDPPEVDDDLRQLALAALDRVAEPGANEWYELWEEGDDLDDALAALEPYRAALS